MIDLLIIDGYVDEPTVLGVPFYVSTYVRYVAGAAKTAGLENIAYRTIDQIRDEDYRLPACKLAVIVAGNPVPGKYLGGVPIRSHEFGLLAENHRDIPFYIGGPVWHDLAAFPQSNLRVVRGDIETFVYRLTAGGDLSNYERSIEELNRFAVAGAFIVRQHPRFPDLMIEIETGRGCKRRQHCSFCVEGLYRIDHRRPEDIVAEMKELDRQGARNFRLSKQADLYAYGSKMDEWRDGFPKPDAGSVRRLYEGIRDAIPDIAVLHLDNVNPGTIARFPDESVSITEIVAANNTEGDVAAMGLESADPEVIAANGLKATPEQVRLAVRIVNEFGGRLQNGIPKLLPGINLIRGLPGESRDTFRLNYEYLKGILDEGLLLRRINIRQLKTTGGTPVAGMKTRDRKEEMKLDAVFRNYRQKIRNEIDVPMLRRLFPAGTVFRNMIVEQHRGDWSLVRQIATYPIVANVPRLIDPLSKISVFTVGYRERSLVALPYPLKLSEASLGEWKHLPGVGKRAGEFFVNGAKREDLQSLPDYERWKECVI